MNPSLSPGADRAAPATAEQSRQIQRVRHEPRRRMLTVESSELLTPGMRRIRFRSSDLHDFTSLSADDHIKLFFTAPDGSAVKRDYTPRAFDKAAGEMTIDFALHGASLDEAGPATAWALTAAPGDPLEIGGPKGSAIVPDAYDWRLLVGDETALPAMGRHVEELRPGAPVITIAVVDSAKEVQAFQTAAAWDAEWLCRDRLGRDDAASVRRALSLLFPASGDGFVWIAGEAQFAKALRAVVLEQHGHPPGQMKASGYWVRGSAGEHTLLG